MYRVRSSEMNARKILVILFQTQQTCSENRSKFKYKSIWMYNYNNISFPLIFVCFLTRIKIIPFLGFHKSCSTCLPFTSSILRDKSLLILVTTPVVMAPNANVSRNQFFCLHSIYLEDAGCIETSRTQSSI